MMDGPDSKASKSSSKMKSFKPISLKQLAAHLDLDPSTVSVVLNDAPGRSISAATRDRIKAAAREMNYQPNLLARSLRSQRTLTVGILVPELGEGYHTQIMAGIGDQLIGAGYFYLTAHHRHQPNMIEEYIRMLVGRGAQGLIAVDTLLEHPLPIPTVTVAGHRRLEGITNVVLDHAHAAALTLDHLYGLGHREIAFMRGQPFSSDSDVRWKELQRYAGKLGLKIRPELVVTLDRDMSSPELGYPVVQQLMAAKRPFSALVAFNDIAAFGSIRAFQDLNLSVPKDVSVIGFDDVNASSYSSPRLTTIRQPLAEMGRIATQALLNKINDTTPPRGELVVQPTLVIRESTGPALKRSRA